MGVTVSLYPEIEWLSAIASEIKEFQKRMDERDKIENLSKQEADIDDVDEVNEAILDTLINEETGYNASSSSASSDEENKKDEIEESENKKNDDEEEEIIYFEDSDSEKDKKNKKEEKEQKKQAIMFKKIGRKRLEELVDKKSVSAYDHYLFLKEMECELQKFETKWPVIDLMDEHHPRRQYIDSVISKCDNKLPCNALSDFSWSSPIDYPDKIPRGKIIGIYESKAKNKENIPGFLQPMIYNEHGQIDRKWAIFIPSDKR